MRSHAHRVEQANSKERSEQIEPSLSLPEKRKEPPVSEEDLERGRTFIFLPS